MIGGMLGAIVATCLNTKTGGAYNGGSVVNVGNRQLSFTDTGAISRAFVGFGTGAVAGQSAGADIDENVIRAYQCHACGLKF